MNSEEAGFTFDSNMGNSASSTDLRSKETQQVGARSSGSSNRANLGITSNKTASASHGDNAGRPSFAINNEVGASSKSKPK